MPKRRAVRRAAAGSGRRALRGKVVLVSLALCLTASGLAWAGWGRSGVSRKAEPYGARPPAAPAAPAPAPPPPQSLSPTSPAKEYVYSGGRLVATEEPAPLLAQTITFAQPPDRTYGDADFALSASASSGLAVGFAAAGNCTVAGSTMHITGAGTCTVTASQGGSANYSAAASVARTFAVAKAASTTAVTAADATYDGQPHGGTAVVTGVGGLSQGLAVSYGGRNGTVYGPSATAPTNAGDYTASASFGGGANHNGSAGSKDFRILKAAATLTLSGLSQTYNGSPRAVTVTTSPAGLSTVSVTYNGSATAPTNAGSYAVAATLTHQNYAGSASGTLVVAKATATLTLSGLTGHVYNGSPQAVTVTTTPSGLSGVGVTYNGSAAAPTAAGSYAVVATLTHANYSAAAVSGTMAVAKATPVITWNNPADIAQGTALSATQLNATANTSGTFAYTPAAGTVLNAGLNQTLSMSFTPADGADFNPASASVSINVYACPKAVGSSFTRTPSPVAPGTPSTLSWSVPNATAVTIGGVAGTFGATGSTSVSPAATTTYTLTATGAAVCPALTMQTSVAVQGCPTAAGSSFKVGDGTTMDPPPPNDTITIQQGGSALLIWSAPNATAINIVAEGACPPNDDSCNPSVFSGSSTGGAVTVSPAQTTTYTLNVAGAQGCAAFQKQVTVEVVPAECAPGAYFTSSPPTGNCGGDVTLSWGVPGAASVTITDDMDGSPLGTFGASGMVGVVPQVFYGGSYTLTAQMDGSSSCQVFTLNLVHPCKGGGGGGGGE
ncbi:MAG: hypothetical protein JOZ02_04225 [Acidobacteria bacterium]|nr:hypothetical protein [Acidobacteriota bacterium]